MIQTIGFIGGGNMASSLIGGLVKQDVISADSVYLFEPSQEQAQSLKKQYGINLCRDNTELVQACDAVVIAVKPQVLESVLQPLKRVIAEKMPLLVSVVAGIRASSIEQWSHDQVALVRVMPNTPALIGKGASGLFGNKNTTEEHKRFTESILSSVGICQWVDDEDQIDIVTALSGSGPAYFMLFMQCLIKAASKAGLDESAATQLAVHTAVGAAELVATSTQPIQTLIDNVTSPNGTTAAALQSFDESNLAVTVENALLAAKQRSKELADELG